MRIERLPIGDIKVIAKRHRPVVQKRVQLIAASITAIGFIYPIVVHVGKDGPVLDQGQHRLEAAKSLGWKRIRCLVWRGIRRKGALVLLRHNFRCLPCAEIGPAQQGHRDSVATRATINLRRIVAMEFGTWRSGRNGGPSGPISFGNCNFREQPGGTSS